MLVLALAYWAQFARLGRALVLAARNLPYIEAARAAGAANWRLTTAYR